MDAPSGELAAIRRFARTVTARLGAGDERWRGRGRALGHSRLLFALRDGPVPLQRLRDRLGLDSGYASRVVHALADDGLVRVEADPRDGRARSVRLTDDGTTEVATLDRLLDEAAADLVAALDGRRRAVLVEAMGTVARLLDAAAVVVGDADPGSEEVARAHHRYAEELAGRFPGGFDPTGLGAEADRHRPPDGACVGAWLDGELVGTVALAALDPAGEDDDVATPVREVKRMWVDPGLRGGGVGRRLLAAVEDRARELGTATLRLDTNETLTAAIALYDSAGYRRIERYNDNPDATHFMEKSLVA